MTAPTAVEVTKLARIHRLTVQNMSDAELERAAERDAALPPSPLATELRHADESEMEHRRVQRRLAGAVAA